ncbi:hypothetical protein S7335_2186 [Synechococcus sp. PCC 7335]|uniref:autotransporter family protein n=1 Tax=Synechococcus sp. (strain ATCC 29403 / PCC 7335) TaxID=91464 RepID=UPI00017EC3ED|nr:autotransporter domain-containing protein [Synechococcus sp. PCC 7335]EDX84489.1 hypothetical protein S7335_2186 [Synechococcus sp. PCC 7335]
MNQRFRLSVFTLVCLGSAFIPSLTVTDRAIAACIVENTETAESEGTPGNNPTSRQTIVCANNLDNAGVNGPAANQVTVQIQAPAGGISVTGQPGILLGNSATITVEGPGRPINTSGDSATGIDVLEGATITINGVVSTSGEVSPGVTTGENATITVDGGTVRTGGGESPAISAGADSTVEIIGNARIETGNSNSDAIVLAGENGKLTVGSEAIVTTSSGMSNPIQVDGAGSSVTVAGDVRSSSGNATAIFGTAENITITVQDGGVVTAQSSNSNAIEITSTGAIITVENGGEVKISSGNSAAIVSGDNGTVNLDGTVTASSSQSQGVMLGNGAELNVRSRGIIETSSSESQAVLIDEMAATATVNVERGGNIDAVGAQAIVDRGMTNTTVVVDGTVFGGSSEPVLDLGAGDDTVTVNGTVRASSASPVIDLGEGNDTLNDNSSQTIEGPGILASGGSGMDTLNLSNGKPNDSTQYSGFEMTNVGRNNNPEDPANGQETTFEVTDDQSGNQINAREGGRVNVQEGGTADVTPDTEEGSGSGQQGGTTRFAPGSTANVRTENRTGPQATQQFSNTRFEGGTRVRTGSGFVRGTAANNEETRRGEIAIESDFANEASGENARSFGNALNELAADSTRTSEQQAALDELIAQASSIEEAQTLVARISGEIGAQTAASGVRAAALFNSVLLPSNSSDARRNLSTAAGVTTPVLIATKQADGIEIVEEDANNGVWVSGFGGAVDVDDNEFSTDFNSGTYGLAVGYDRALRLGSNLAAVGVGIGYFNTDVDGTGDSANINAYSLGAYFEGARGPLTGNVAASYSYLDIGNGNFGDGNGNIFVASSEGFYNLSRSDNFIVGPLGQVGVAFGGYSGFDSEGSAIAVNYDGEGISQVNAGFGVRVGGQTDTGAGLLSLNLDLLYAGALGDRTIQFDGQLANSTVSTAAPFANDDSFLVGAEAGLAISDSTTVGVRYDGEFGGDIRSHSGELKVLFQF